MTNVMSEKITKTDIRNSPSFTKPKRVGGFSSSLRETQKKCQKKQPCVYLYPCVYPLSLFSDAYIVQKLYP